MLHFLSIFVYLQLLLVVRNNGCLQLTIPKMNKYLHCYGYCINLRLGFIIKDWKSSVSTAAVCVHIQLKFNQPKLYITLTWTAGESAVVIIMVPVITWHWLPGDHTHVLHNMEEYCFIDINATLTLPHDLLFEAHLTYIVYTHELHNMKSTEFHWSLVHK